MKHFLVNLAVAFSVGVMVSGCTPSPTDQPESRPTSKSPTQPLNYSANRHTRPLLFKDTFDSGEPSPKWQLMRMQFEVRDGKLQVVSAPRTGFQYGHSGHGRGAVAFVHIGDKSWKNYRLSMDIYGGGAGAFNPHGISDCMRGSFSVYFRTEDYPESWNEAGHTAYRINFNPMPKLCNGGPAGDAYLGRINNWYSNIPSGWSPGVGTDKTLQKIDGNLFHIDAPNHVVIAVRGRHINVRVNGKQAADYEDTDSEALTYGGIGAGWEWDNTGWIDNVVVTKL